MERGLTLLIATVMVFLTSGVRGTAHLSFDNSTQVDITRAGCGDTKLCVELPDDCDPAADTGCLFASLSATPLMPPNGTDLSVELSGNSSGYIAVGLTADASVGTSLFFFCAQDNGTFFFRTMSRNNSNSSMFSPEETIVTGIRSRLNGSVIQCEFTVPHVNATSTRNSDAGTFAVIIASGMTNGAMIENPMTIFNNPPTIIPGAVSNVSTTPTPATNMTTMMTTSGVSSFFTPHTMIESPTTILTSPQIIIPGAVSNVSTTPTPATNMTTMMTTSGVSSFFTPHTLLLPLSVLALFALKTV